MGLFRIGLYICVPLGPMNSVKFVNRRRRYVTLWYSGVGVYWGISRHSLTVTLIGSSSC